jgi:hypothetical protein
MNRLLALAIGACVVLSVSAPAAPQLQRVRGTIESVDNNGVTVRSSANQDTKVAFEPDTKFVSVVKSDLAALQPGSFIGTATKGPPGSMVALEVVIFPESMRGTGEGHYAWDMLPDTTMRGGHKVMSSMTNGNVDTSNAAGAASKVRSTMTNGNVEASGDQSGARQITVSYAGGKQQITVPPSVPIVAFEPADRSIAVRGAKVFIVAAEDGGKLSAKLVGVGKDGVTPPM